MHSTHLLSAWRERDPDLSIVPRAKMASITRPLALLCIIFLTYSSSSSFDGRCRRRCCCCDALSIAGGRIIRPSRPRSPSSSSTRQQSRSTRRPNNVLDDAIIAASSARRTARVQYLANYPPSSSSTTALRMVLSTPENIIEQASTQKLLDAILDESVRTQSRHPVMMQFNPSQGWIWRQWRGTVFSETWKSCLKNMALATLVVFLYRSYPNLRDLLQGFSILWGQLLSVTTFTLTFFLNQSYGLWRKCYDYSRRLQGRLNDLGMTLAAHATRTKPTSPDVPSTYTPQSRQALELVSRYVRVFNLLTYASFTRSHRPILTPRGMRRLVERGILTSREREILTDAEVPATQRHNAVLVWLIRLFAEGRQAGIFEGGMGFEEQFLEKCHVIRAQYGAIGDELQGRMPLAYAHIVQVLLDVVLWMYPFMALSTGMAWYIGIVGTGLLTMFYQGLFDLAKQFLDPYDNENYGKGDDPLVIDTLIAETNAGSVRWMNSFQQQPWNRQSLIDGELSNLILPLRGYSTEYLEEKQVQEERERQEREGALREKRRKEEERERQRAEALLLVHVASTRNNGTIATALGERLDGSAVLTPAGEVLMNSEVVVGKVYDNMTFMEVSGGEVVATSSLLSPGSYAAMKSNNDASVSKSESWKVSTTATISAEKSATDGGKSYGQNVVPAAVSEEVPPAAVDAPPLLDDAESDIARSVLGATPSFEDGAADMDDYKNEFDGNLDDDDIEDDDYFAPIPMEWFDEVGPDGNEYRLSQMLADEDWSFDDEGGVEDEAVGLLQNDLKRVLASQPMTYDEFAQKASEIIDQVNNEIAETKEIMSVSPGRDAEYDVKNNESNRSPTSFTSRRAVADDPEPLYDQTKLDGISQLWGAPPEVLQRKMVEEYDYSGQGLINDGIDFRNIYSLWGSPVPSGITSIDEEEKAPLIPSMEGLSQLWNENVPPYEEEESDGIEDDSIDHVGQRERVVDFRAFAGLEWWDRVSEDGKEVRLSQILADEEYNEAMDEEAEPPMTFERFTEETEKLIEQAEFERKETEAILKAPPNAAFLESDEYSPAVTSLMEESVASSDKYEAIILSLSEENGSDDDTDEGIDNSVSPTDAYQKMADVAFNGNIEPIMNGDSD